MNKQPFSRIMALVLSVALVFTMIPFTVSVKAAGCTHEHDAECGYVEGHYVEDGDVEDVDLEDDDLENDLDGEPATSSNTKPTSPSSKGRYVEGTPCQHEHDELCGGLIDSGKTPGKSGEESELVVVAEFDELDEYTLYQGFDIGEIESQDEIILPDILTGTDTDDNAITMEGVIWESDPEFDPAVSIEYPGYIFSPVLPEGYVLAAGVTAPEITVFIRPGDLLPQPMSTADQLVSTINTYSDNNKGSDHGFEAVALGNTITVTDKTTGGSGSPGVTGATNQLSLTIDSDVTVVWKATLSGAVNSSSLIQLSGAGTFEVATDGTIQNSGTALGTYSIEAIDSVTVMVTDGIVRGIGTYTRGIYLSSATAAVAVTGGTVTSASHRAIDVGSGVVYYSGGNVQGPNAYNHIYIYNSTAKGFYTENNANLFYTSSTNLFKLDELVSLKLKTSGTAYDGSSATTEDVVAELLGELIYTRITATNASGTQDLNNGKFTFNDTVNRTDVSLNATGTFTGTNLSVSFTIENITLNINKSGANPEVNGISPSFVSGDGTTTITLTGQGFTSATDVKVNGVSVGSFTKVSNTEITFTAPLSTTLGAVNVVVTFPGGDSTPVTLTYVPANLIPVFEAVQAYVRGGGSGGVLKATLDSQDTNTVIITNDGSTAITGANQTLTLDIPSGATVKWAASLTGSTGTSTALLSLPGNGTLEVAVNGLLRNNGQGSYTIHATDTGANAAIIVNGGTVRLGGDYGYAILANGANAKVTVSSGTVEVPSTNGYAIRATSSNHIITVSGGTVQGGSSINNSGIYSSGNSAAVAISGGSVSGTSPVTLASGSTVYYSGGTVDSGGIRIYTSNSATGYYTGNNSDKFRSSDFSETSNLFKLDGVTLSPTTGIAFDPATVTATLSAKLTVTGVSVSGLSSGYTINSDKTVTFSGITPTTNITLTVIGTITSANIPVSFDTETFSVSIVDKYPLTITGVTATSRAYNGSTMVAFSGGTLQGIQGSDQVSFTLGNGTMVDANVGDNKVVTTNIQLTGADANKYQLTPPTVTVNITPKALTISGFSISKQYDGSNTVAGFATLTFSGLENSETANVDMAGVTATYDNANAGTGKAITFGGNSFGMMTTGGTASAGNYSITQPTNITGTITKALLTGATVTLVAGPYTYTGSAITPAVTSVSAGGIGAVPTDYTVDYSSNISVGTATVTLTATASGNFSGSAGTTFTIGKANGPNAPASVTGSYTGDGTTFTYTVTPIAGAEYSNDNTSWQDSNIFTGFTTASPATAFYARIKETATHEVGAAGNTGAITFTKLDDRAAPPLAFAMSDGGFPKTVAITLVTGAEYSFNGTTYSQTNTYTSNSGESLTLYIRLAETDTHNASSPSTVTIDTSKQNQAEPPMFTLDYNANGDTDYTVTIPATTGAEYSFDGQTWSGIYTKTNCHPGDIITGYKRMAETSALNASTATIASVTLPLFQVKTPTAITNGGSFTTSQSVTLSCATTDASIYYTTDGTTPTTGSTLYSVAFTIADTTTVKAIAVKAGMTDSAMLEVTFTKAPILSGDATLSALTISSGTLTPAFNPAATSYTVTVANSVNSVTVTATANHANATVSGADTKALVAGANTITITVTAQDGTTNTYTITITREGSGGSNGGGSSSSGSSSSPRYNISTAKQHGMPKVATMTYTGTVQDNQLTGTITKDMVQADVNAAGTDPDGIALTFIITNSSGYNSQTISIAGDALDLLRSSSVKYVQVQTGIFRFHFDSAAISSLDSQTTGTVTVNAAPVSPLSDAANAAIGSRPVFDFTVHDSTGNTVTSYGSGTVTRGIRYTADSTENTGSLFIVKIVDGNVQWIDRSSYDNGWMIWSGDSNSVYGVGYKAPAPAFTDTTGHWAKDDIDFAASRGLISGTGAAAFSPDTAITRADFLMALGRLSGMDVSGYTAGSFTDVPAANPAMPYIEWAVANNIVQGIGDNNFGPDHHITREQMAVIMVNYAEATNYTLPISRQAITFADDAQISAYAKEAVKAIQQTGVISSKADNLFDPQGSVTRAEAGTILRRFTKLVIDGNTARGWVRNDTGQWQYITPDGRTVTGWLNTASGIWYWFGDKGIMATGEWIQISGKWYYFYGDGQMATNVIIDGYTIGEDGVMQESEH